ncbi:MAG: glycerophosphodiester phosphodiesterase family protein [Steroidobacteraceae bacterium]
MRSFFVRACSGMLAALLCACQGGGAAQSPEKATASAQSSSDSSVKKNSSYSGRLALNSTQKLPLITAHRGGGAYAPENTLSAFTNAARLGVDYIEMDVWLHPSGNFMVIHDLDLARTTDCAGSFSALSLANLALCDDAHWWQPGVAISSSGIVGPLAGMGIKIPSLEDVLVGLNAVGSKQSLLVEIKYPAGYTRATVDQSVTVMINLLARLDPQHKVIMESFDSYLLSKIRTANPLIKTMQLGGIASYTTTSCLKSVNDTVMRGFDFFAVDSGSIDAATLAACVAGAQASGLKFQMWNVNSPEVLQRAVNAGVDAVMTDFPACMMENLGLSAPDNPYTMELEDGETYPKCHE